jgi:hypothetical protein
VFCCLETQSDVGPNDNDSLARKIDMLHWSYFPPLILEEPEKRELSHDIERGVEGDFTKRPQFSQLYAVHHHQGPSRVNSQ